MSKSINFFKNANTGNSLYSAAPEITNIKHENSKITLTVTGGLDTGDQLLGFDHACKVVNVAFTPTAGNKAGCALYIYRGTTSLASAVLARILPVALNTKTLATSFYPGAAEIPNGGALTFVVSGTNWATSMGGRLLIETMPL